MSTAILKREPLVIDETVDEVDLMLDELDRQSRTKLGYQGLARTATQLRQKAALQQALADLDIQPFTEASIRAYKQRSERTANGPLGETISAASGLSCLLSLLSLPVLLVLVLLGSAAAAFYAALVFILSAAVAVGGAVLSSQLGLERKWKMRKLSLFREPIPAFALQTALDIRERCPEAEFFVCTLEEKQKVVDPFLVLRSGDTDYYLEVWNEPEFSNRREA